MLRLVRSLRLAFLSCCVVAPLAAQHERGDELVDTPEKKKILAKAAKAFVADSQLDYVVTKRFLVVFRNDGKTDEERKTKADAARADATARMEPMFDLCESILPPHPRMDERFAVYDKDDALVEWKAPSLPEGATTGPWSVAFARAKEQDLVVGPMLSVGVWAVYEKAWFSDRVPGGWFRDLAIARLHAESVARERPAAKKQETPQPFDKQDARDWLKIPKKDLQACVMSFQPDIDEHDVYVGDPASRERQFLAAFLGHAKADLGDAMPKQAAALTADYPQHRLAGEKEADASKPGFAELDRKALLDAMTRWAKSKTK